MLAAESFWIFVLFFEIWFYLNWFFTRYAASRCLFLSLFFHWRLFFTPFLRSFVLVRLLPKLIQTIFEAVIVSFSPELILTVSRGSLGFALTCGCVDGKFFVDDWFITKSAWGSSRFALFKVSIKVFGGNIELAIFAKLGLHVAGLGMLIDFVFLEHLTAMFAFGCSVKLLLVVVKKVLIVHFSASWAFDDVSATVAEMRGRFGDWDVLAAVGASLSLFHNQ